MIVRRTALYSILMGVVVLFFFYSFFYQTPKTFKDNSMIRIESGKSVFSVSKMLEKEGIVSSSFWLTNLVILMGGEHRVVAGYYFFDRPNNLFRVAHRITHGNYEIIPVKITVPEGLNIYEIAELYKSKFNFFDKEAFLTLVKDKEGYLFPETYFFVPTVLVEDIVSMMNDTFKEQIRPLNDSISSSGRNLNEIVTMASILEGEAIKSEDRKIIAGILWKRLAAGIPLQVDATFKYINGKKTSELSLADLKIDSPYNTYKYRGLPPTPISNPGLDSIKAALSPTTSNYLYFLSDKDGNIHYAKTLPEHATNKRKYL